MKRLVHLKDLNKVKRSKKYRLEQILVVDDRSEVLARQYGNLVPVVPFTGDPGDETLKLLSGYLLRLAEVDNVRRVEKRFWRGAGTHRN